MSIIIFVPRGPKNTTNFSLNGGKKIGLKPLYKAFSQSKNYEDVFPDATIVVETEKTNPLLTITNKISVNPSGMLSIRSSLESKGEKQKINLTHQLNVFNSAISDREVKLILDSFVKKIELPSMVTS